MMHQGVIRDSTDIILEMEQELQYIPSIPVHEEMSMRQQQLELSMSCQHIISLVQELLDRDKYLLERLKHADAERFK